MARKRWENARARLRNEIEQTAMVVYRYRQQQGSPTTRVIQVVQKVGKTKKYTVL